MSAVLLVYGYAPSGHSSAAFAIEKAGRKAGLSFSRLEIAVDEYPILGQCLARGYHALVRGAPGLYGALYRSRWTQKLFQAARGAYLGLGGVRRLREAVRRVGAAVVVCPQATVASVLSEARRRGDLDVPVISVLTDYHVHSCRADPPADIIIAPDETAGVELVRLGVPRARVRVFGIPIDVAFSATRPREEARRLLKLPLFGHVVLLTGGGKGLGDITGMATALFSAVPRAQLLILCGANESLRSSLSARLDARLRVFGPQPPSVVALLMAASDIHLGKPGGLTTAESLAMGLPLVIGGPCSGQEEANARHLLAKAAALRAETPREAASLVAELLHSPDRLARLRARASNAGIPDSAAKIVAEIAACFSFPSKGVRPLSKN